MPAPRLGPHLVLATLCWLGTATPCGAEDGPAATRSPRLVLLYATCTVNKSFLGPYEPTVSYTPHLSAFARRSLVFMRHQTESPQSAIAFASIFSGTEADRHRVYSPPSPVADGVPLAPDVFRKAGFAPHAWLDHPMAGAALGYARGTPAGQRFDRPLRADDPAFARVLQRLRDDPTYRAFVVTAFTVTHTPYPGHDIDGFCQAFPSECRARPSAHGLAHARGLLRRHSLPLSFDFDRARGRLGLEEGDVERLATVAELSYKADVHHLDALFGHVLGAIRAAKLESDSLIVFTADHGEVMYRENARFKWSHSLQLAPEALGVPLVVFAPTSGLPPQRVTFVTRSMDVLPTMAGLAGIAPSPADVTGTDLSDAVRRRGDPALRAYSHTAVLPAPLLQASKNWPLVRRAMPRTDPDLMWVAVRERDLVVKLESEDGSTFTPTAYDLASDPFESHELYDPDDARHGILLERLRAYKSRLIRGYHARGETTGVPAPEQADRLRALGYIE